MPMTNAHGYANYRRWENNMDPNRDFPYLQKPEKCMQTQTARAVNDSRLLGPASGVVRSRCFCLARAYSAIQGTFPSASLPAPQLFSLSCFAKSLLRYLGAWAGSASPFTVACGRSPTSGVRGTTWRGRSPQSLRMKQPSERHCAAKGACTAQRVAESAFPVLSRLASPSRRLPVGLPETSGSTHWARSTTWPHAFKLPEGVFCPSS